MDFVTECKRDYEMNPKPLKLGNFTCLMYTKAGQPLIALGPDWVFSLVEVLIINGICGYFLWSMGQEHEYLYSFGLGLVIMQNISFALTALGNPGLPPRDPSIHSQAYLNKVKIFK